MGSLSNSHSWFRKAKWDASDRGCKLYFLLGPGANKLQSKMI